MEITVDNIAPAKTKERTKDPGYSPEEIRRRLKSYATPNNWIALFQVFSTLALIGALYYLQFRTFQMGYWPVTLLLSPIVGLLLVRDFVLQHDCGHGSLFTTRWANDLCGIFLTNFSFTPYYSWRYSHNLHHATNGNLDRREGYFWIMTVEEYRAASSWEKFKYRVYRHPLTLFSFGAFLYFLIRRRFPIDIKVSLKREFLELLFSNLLIIGFNGLLLWHFGWQATLVVVGANLLFGACFGTFVNYVQHFLPDAYMKRAKDWDFSDASLLGSSFYDIPQILHWFTASIGYHHIHHFESRIPNYRLAQCMRENRELFKMPVVKLSETFSLMKYELWDEANSRFVSIRSVQA